MSDHAAEVARGERFEFGKNWQHFLRALTPQRIAEAERSLQQMLGVQDLTGTSFLDMGSGSGLFSLAARRLGARVHSFDYDPHSVACTRELKRRYCLENPQAEDAQWVIEEGSVLDTAYLKSLGKFDLVYSWGVLHHTGAMWQALANATIPLTRGGRLFISIYNWQELWTPTHTALKRAYVRWPRPFNTMLAGLLMLAEMLKGLAKDLLFLRNPIARYKHYDRSRGMSWWYDCWDWIGGYPFETAPAEAIFDFFQQRGCVLERLITCGGKKGCNQFVFRQAVDAWRWSKQPYTLVVEAESRVESTT